MKFSNLSILDIVHLDAPEVVTSASLDDKMAPLLKMMGMQTPFVEGLTGIQERRYWPEGVQPSQVATEAAEILLKKTGLDRKKIGLIINSSVCKDYIEPSVASIVHGNLSLVTTCINFDIGNACLAFLNAIEVAGLLLEKGQIDYALLVNGEGSRQITEKTIARMMTPGFTPEQFRAQFASLTLGSGAAAMILTRTELAPNGHQVLGSVALSNTKMNHLCRGHADEMQTDASTLLVEGLKLASETFNKACKELQWHEKEFKDFIIHQVSRKHTEKFAESINVPLEKISPLFNKFGNIGPASIPIALSKAVEAGRIQKGDRVGLLGIGSGINCAMMEVLW